MVFVVLFLTVRQFTPVHCELTGELDVNAACFAKKACEQGFSRVDVEVFRLLRNEQISCQLVDQIRSDLRLREIFPLHCQFYKPVCPVDIHVKPLELKLFVGVLLSPLVTPSDEESGDADECKPESDLTPNGDPIGLFVLVYDVLKETEPEARKEHTQKREGEVENDSSPLLRALRQLKRLVSFVQFY